MKNALLFQTIATFEPFLTENVEFLHNISIPTRKNRSLRVNADKNVEKSLKLQVSDNPLSCFNEFQVQLSQLSRRDAHF